MFMCQKLFMTSAAHSFLTQPKGDYGFWEKPECRVGGPPHAPNDSCRGPCIEESSWMFDKDAGVEDVYARGQNVHIKWTRNNHRGGFVRLALVPRDQRMNRTAHRDFAFWFGCFDMGNHRCQSPMCGTDERNIAYSALVRIPTVLPDGDYVLGWTWYGGITSGLSYFGDYWSCSFVRVQGGPRTKHFDRVFSAGTRSGSLSHNTCMSAVNSMGQCVREPCYGHRGAAMVPAPFANGRRPPPLVAPWATDTISSSSSSPHSKLEFTQSPSPAASMDAAPSSDGPALPSMTPSPSPTVAANKVLVTGLHMIDIGTKDVLATKYPSTVFVPKQAKQLTFVARTSGNVESVSFELNCRYVRTEYVRPYSFFGDIDGELFAWARPVFGKWLKLNVSAVSPTSFRNYKVFWVQLLPA